MRKLFQACNTIYKFASSPGFLPLVGVVHVPPRCHLARSAVSSGRGAKNTGTDVYVRTGNLCTSDQSEEITEMHPQDFFQEIKAGQTWPLEGERLLRLLV
jgi:hypothetical protein